MISKQYVKSLAKRNPNKAHRIAVKIASGWFEAAHADTNGAKRDKAWAEFRSWASL